MRRTRPILDRFWEKVDKDGPGGCWIWTAYLSPDGYGSFWVTDLKRKVRAHRFSYELVNGTIPQGLDIDHLCRVPGCVNPAHLEAVTPSENKLRGVGAPAVNARKTHCIRGHEFTTENTSLNAEGYRTCRACCAVRDRRKRERRSQRRLAA